MSTVDQFASVFNAASQTAFQHQPPALENALVVTDLEPDAARSVARINGYVHAVAALEAKVDCDWVKVTLKFVDQDPEKLDYLSRLIASGTAQAHYSPSA